MLRNVFLPLISLLSGLISLYIDPKEEKNKTWIIISVLLVSAVATGVSGSIDDLSADHEAATAERRIDGLTELSVNQSAQLLRVSGDVAGVKSGVFVLLQERGLSAKAIVDITPEQIQQSNLADAAWAQMFTSQSVANRNKDLIVQYYPKDFDGEIVKQALAKGGFNFRAGEPKNNLETNAVWVGDSVTPDNAKFIGLTLLRAGVRLRSIRRFKDGGGLKSNLIEVGADPATTDSPVLTVDRIEGLTQLPPRDLT